MTPYVLVQRSETPKSLRHGRPFTNRALRAKARRHSKYFVRDRKTGATQEECNGSVESQSLPIRQPGSWLVSQCGPAALTVLEPPAGCPSGSTPFVRKYETVAFAGDRFK